MVLLQISFFFGSPFKKLRIVSEVIGFILVFLFYKHVNIRDLGVFLYC